MPTRSLPKSRLLGRVWRLLLLGCLIQPASAAAPAPLAVLVLLQDPPALTRALARARLPPDSAARVQQRRDAILSARHGSFSARRAMLDDQLHEILHAVPGHVLEALPALNAYLVYVPVATAPVAVAALRDARRARRGDLAYVAVQGRTPLPPPLAALSDAPLLHPPGCSNCQTTAEDTPALTLGIIDSGADPAHPWLADGLGRMYFRPGTPGARSRGLLRSHGTAMLGVYAQQALGQPLRANRALLERPGSATPYTATVVARAGPETSAGRTGLVRSLAWMVTPTAGRPVPDLLNYSQGNGPLCARAAGDCRTLPWFGVTRALDRLAEELAILVVKSAGNGGYRPGTSMTVPGDTYNGITVGNMHAFDWRACRASSARASHKIYRTSSTAPAGGPRLLDLVAPGVRIETAGVDPTYCEARCDTPGGPGCDFCPRLGSAEPGGRGFRKMNSGTSPAAAVTGAAAARLLQAGVQHPMRVKAILINSADSWDSREQAHPAVRGDGTGCATDTAAAAHGPYSHGAHYDRSYGWGYLNPARAYAEADSSLTAALGPGVAHCYAVELAPWEKVTLVWQRRATPCASCGVDGWARLSALDLALHGTEAPHPVLDRDATRHPLDNVLQVSNGRGPARAARRQVLVRVSFATPHLDAAAAEPYALAAARPLQRQARCPPPRTMPAAP